MSALYPDVPVALGVPAVLRGLANANDEQQGAALIASNSTDPITSNDWGVFDQSGSRLLTPDSIVSVEFGGEYRISDYPTENGGFQSYNKVAMPFEVRVTMTKGGSLSDREAFLIALETLRASLTLVDVATPDRVYVGVNLTRLGQARTATSGAGMSVIEATFQEVRQTVTITYTKNDPIIAPADDAAIADAPKAAAATPSPAPASKIVAPKAPSAAPRVNQGSVQASAPLPGWTLVKTATGKLTYKYDKPIGL